jgi:hypothetical protein
MMTHGMGYLGIAGPYRLNCERVMRVLRDNRDSLMAMLEAFVYDPLISWLFLTHKVRTYVRAYMRPSVRPVGLRSGPR